ncbi:MAG: NAD(P)-dependent oxidoreductase, partial [Nocardioides sp.]|nr:NAD(P)-dependent oxidoreductase [Nocardioides sp.]
MTHDTGDVITIALLGLGEAGSAFAADLVAAGAVVRGYDPAVPAPAGVVACGSEAEAVTGADLVISVNSASVAVAVARAAGPALAPGAVWADANSASPARKSEVAAALPDGALVTDV